MQNKLVRIEIEGFKSIRNQKLDLGDINVLIGSNGAGKTNFISIFKMLNFMTSDGLQVFVSQAGGSNTLLFYGAKITPQMILTLKFFDKNQNQTLYNIRLSDAAPDTLIFADEYITWWDRDSNQYEGVTKAVGHKEAVIKNWGQIPQAPPIDRHVFDFLQACRVFHFQDTSETALMRRSINIDDNHYFKSDGGNIAAFLYMLKKTKSNHYSLITSTIRSVAPFFGDFILEPDKLNPKIILLNWKESGSDYLFGPHQISDGLLRFIALTTLLLQPQLPSLIIIDEPELGLHPYAINILGGLVRKASKQSQIILSTQSEKLVDQFQPEEIIVVDRENGESKFNHLEREKLQDWLEEYSLGELWDKNVIGGRPSR